MQILDIVLHLDKTLGNIINTFGGYTYGILFAIIFAETGLVVAPFLPGDSLLFVVGAFSGVGLLNIWTAYFAMLAAAIVGDSVNYWIGRSLGPKIFSQEHSRFFNRAYLDRTQKFYEQHGGKTVILARFLPILRTFAPFVAGIGKMNYRTFLFYSVTGSLAWISLLTFAGYFFGGLEIVKNNFEKVIIGIIVLSLIPVFYEYFKSSRKKAEPQDSNPII